MTSKILPATFFAAYLRIVKLIAIPIEICIPFFGSAVVNFSYQVLFVPLLLCVTNTRRNTFLNLLNYERFGTSVKVK